MHRHLLPISFGQRIAWLMVAALMLLNKSPPGLASAVLLLPVDGGCVRVYMHACSISCPEASQAAQTWSLRLRCVPLMASCPTNAKLLPTAHRMRESAKNLLTLCPSPVDGCCPCACSNVCPVGRCCCTHHQHLADVCCGATLSQACSRYDGQLTAHHQAAGSTPGSERGVCPMTECFCPCHGSLAPSVRASSKHTTRLQSLHLGAGRGVCLMAEHFWPCHGPWQGLSAEPDAPQLALNVNARL